MRDNGGSITDNPSRVYCRGMGSRNNFFRLFVHDQ